MRAEKIPIRAETDSFVDRPGDLVEGLEAVGNYTVVCCDADGNVKWEESFPNLVTTLGKNFLLDSALSGSAYTAAFYLSLVDGASAPSYSAADTSSSHSGWAENGNYSAASRPAVGFNAASGGSKSSSAVTFAISASMTAAGCFLSTSNAKGGTAGTLISAGNFSAGSRPLLSGDSLSVTYSLSI